MLETSLTKAEIDFLIEISHYQDDAGKIYGVYYKDICKAIGISAETFYVTMHSLVEKGFLDLNKSHYTDWDIVIRGNDFTYPGALKEGYINTGHDLFYSDSFRALKGNEKLLAMQLLKISGVNKRYRIGMDVFLEKYANLFRVTRRTIQAYIHSLKRFFKICIKNRLYVIIPEQECFKYNAPGDSKNLSDHLVSVACRRNRATYTDESLKDTIGLVKQYLQIYKHRLADIFLKAVGLSIERVNDDIPDKYRWDRQLNPAFIHRLMRNNV